MIEVIIGTDTRENNVRYIGTRCDIGDSSFTIFNHINYFAILHPWFRNFELYIFDNSYEYQILINYMNKRSPYELEEFLVPLFIRNMKNEDIVNVLCDIGRQGFNEGRTFIQNNMRKILGLVEDN